MGSLRNNSKKDRQRKRLIEELFKLNPWKGKREKAALVKLIREDRDVSH